MIHNKISLSQHVASYTCCKMHYTAPIPIFLTWFSVDEKILCIFWKLNKKLIVYIYILMYYGVGVEFFPTSILLTPLCFFLYNIYLFLLRWNDKKTAIKYMAIILQLCWDKMGIIFFSWRVKLRKYVVWYKLWITYYR